MKALKAPKLNFSINGFFSRPLLALLLPWFCASPQFGRASSATEAFFSQLWRLQGVEGVKFQIEAPTVTLFFIPSPSAILWDSPHSLARSILLNYLSRKARFMGHVAVHVNCGQKRATSGIVAANLNAPQLLFGEKIGLDVLYYGFPGKLEKATPLWEEFRERSHSQRLSFAVFPVSPRSCARAIDYLETFSRENIERYYGLAHDPLKKEGAGCGSYVAGLFRYVGIMDPSLKESWTFNIPIPSRLRKSKTKIPVSFFTLLREKNSFQQLGGRPLRFWSPNKMHQWAQKRHNIAKESGPAIAEQALRWNNSPGVFYPVEQRPSDTWKQATDDSPIQNYDQK